LTTDTRLLYETHIGTYLSLLGARVFAMNGWGSSSHPRRTTTGVELADVGQFIIYQPGLLREKILLSIPIPSSTWSVARSNN
jgi:hypothetical protein